MWIVMIGRYLVINGRGDSEDKVYGPFKSESSAQDFAQKFKLSKEIMYVMVHPVLTPETASC